MYRHVPPATEQPNALVPAHAGTRAFVFSGPIGSHVTGITVEPQSGLIGNESVEMEIENALVFLAE
ncbi:hypothetical protein GCM10009799_09520 [Nocardiopsis rhodophaea]|uniref:Uncharacterized protein n=1 Tax=Nocardiopsis rhodophaea TaxID=280238 RepID=A0ABN2SGF7_9ACTN